MEGLAPVEIRLRPAKLTLNREQRMSGILGSLNSRKLELHSHSSLLLRSRSRNRSWHRD
jgi:hypothetical protein